MSVLARLVAGLVAGLVQGLGDWWREARARSDAIALGRSETIADALRKAADHERHMADQALTPPDAGDVDRRLRDGTF